MLHYESSRISQSEGGARRPPRTGPLAASQLARSSDEIGGSARPAGGPIHQSHLLAPSAAGARRSGMSGFGNVFKRLG